MSSPDKPILALAAAWLLALPIPAAAADQPPAPKPPPSAVQAERADAQRYRKCIALAQQKPADGWEEALAWTGEGGGEPARHCAAVALIGLKQYKEAAARLEDLAIRSQDEPALRAGMLAQAGQARILDGDYQRAYADQTTALKLTPGAPDLLVDRAESLALAKNWADSLVDLNAALAAAPDRVDALTYRATAKRFTGDLAGAAADAARAIALDPRAQGAWLEAGAVKRLQGDANGARQDWLKVLELAPTSPEADDARADIEKLDVKE